jgi:hypothetical protein
LKIRQPFTTSFSKTTFINLPTLDTAHVRDTTDNVVKLTRLTHFF